MNKITNAIKFANLSEWKIEPADSADNTIQWQHVDCSSGLSPIQIADMRFQGAPNW